MLDSMEISVDYVFLGDAIEDDVGFLDIGIALACASTLYISNCTLSEVDMVLKAAFTLLSNIQPVLNSIPQSG